MSTITIYTTPGCVQCNMTKKLFDKAGVDYSTIDLATNDQALAFVKSLGYTSAPVVEANGVIWSGFVPTKIQDAITTAQTPDSTLEEGCDLTLS